MNKLKFPLVKNKQWHYPLEPLCPWCKKNKVFEPHPFVIIGGGAVIDWRHGEHDDMMDGFLYFGFHDHKNACDDGTGMVEIAKDVRGGQFDLYFCSTKCLREFLNHCVDELEKSMKPCPKKRTKKTAKKKIPEMNK